jgi:hypothetical protein
MSIVQERIQENERQLTLDRQKLGAHGKQQLATHGRSPLCSGRRERPGTEPFRAHNKAIEGWNR